MFTRVNLNEYADVIAHLDSFRTSYKPRPLFLDGPAVDLGPETLNIKIKSPINYAQEKLLDNIAHLDSASINSMWARKFKLSGAFYYGTTGYMGWHTNYLSSAQRIYFVYSNQAETSFFRYLQGNEIITKYDDLGWSINMFDIDVQPLFWHCVAANGAERFSFGFAKHG